MPKKRKTQYRRTQFDQTKKLRHDIMSLEEENKSLKSYIRAKNVEDENMKTEIIAEKIILESKLAANTSMKVLV